MILKSFFKYKIHHLLGWMIYFSLSVAGYNSYYENKVHLVLVTSVYLISHASMYYISQYGLIPITFKKGKPWLFFGCYVGLAFILSLIMYGLIYLILKEDLSRYFGEDIKQSFSAFVFSNLFTGGVLIGIKSMIDKSRQQKLDKEKKQENLLSELNFLKAQVNPHFLFNTINSVYVLIKIDPNKAAEMLIKLSDLLRSQLYEFSGEKISIEEEINYLENFIELEKLRKGNRVNIEFEKKGELSNFSLPPLMLIPFLENCFKHLSSNLETPNVVRLKIERSGSSLKVEFANTFDTKEEIKKEGGIGLSNIKRRLALLFPNQHELSMQIKEDLFVVKLHLNLRDYE